MKIHSVDAWQIFDSRGCPTLEAEVRLGNGVTGRGLVPSGASTGQFEACELRDHDSRRFRGKSVFRAIEHVRGELSRAVVGRDVFDQQGLDDCLRECDGTPNKSRLGANALLSVSMAAAQAAAAARHVPLFESLGPGTLLPLPEVQIFGGGAHANWRTDIQDFLIIAHGAASCDDALRITHDVFHSAGDMLKAAGTFHGVADEGGYWPEVQNHKQVFENLIQAIERAGYVPGKDVSLSLDIAASDLFDEKSGLYRLRLEGQTFDTDAWIAKLLDWCTTYPVLSIEDPLADTDEDGWKKFRASAPPGLQIIGDDLFTTNVSRIQNGIAAQLANAVLIKLNQIGTVSETLAAIRLTQDANWNPIVSARSGETEDAFISHLAVATNAGQIKVGSFSRSERMAKWNELLRIQRHLGPRARFHNTAASPAPQPITGSPP